MKRIVLLPFKFFSFWDPTLKLASWGYIHFVMNPLSLEPRHPGGLMKPVLGLGGADDWLCYSPHFLNPFGRKDSCFTSIGGRFWNSGLSTINLQQHHLKRVMLLQINCKIFKEQNWFIIKYGNMEIRWWFHEKKRVENPKIVPSCHGQLQDLWREIRHQHLGKISEQNSEQTIVITIRNMFPSGLFWFSQCFRKLLETSSLRWLYI